MQQCDSTNTQGGSNMTGTDCLQFTHKTSRSYLNHLVYRTGIVAKKLRWNLQVSPAVVLSMANAYCCTTSTQSKAYMNKMCLSKIY